MNGTPGIHMRIDMVWLILLLLPISIPTQTVDLIELNHYRPADGCQGFDQLIFWEYSPDYRRYDAMGFVIINEPCQLPAKDAQGYAVRVNRFGREYIVRSAMYRETTTSSDPERLNLRLLPQELRRGMIWGQ